MTAYKVKVDRNSGTADGWIVQCFHWRTVDDPNPPRVPLKFRREKKSYVADIDLENGLYSIVADLRQGVKITITLDPAHAIEQPHGAKWPVTLEVPGTQTRDIFPIYFRAEVEQ